MDDFEMRSPEERELDIRSEYQASICNLDALIARLLNEYEYFTFLREQISEIDIYGAEDLFCKPVKRKMEASTSPTGYDF